MPSLSKSESARVPAVDKCFAILQLLAGSKQPLGLSEITRELNLNKSTVFNLLHTLVDLNVLEHRPDGKFGFGTQLYLLGRAAGAQSDLIATVRPYLEIISRDSNFSAFLGIRSGLKAVIVDKADAAVDIRVSSDVGMRMPLLAGASGQAILCQLPDAELDQILAEEELVKFTPHTCVDKIQFKRAILEVRKNGIAVDVEEYLLGLVGVAVPLNTYRRGLQAAIWAVGLTRYATDGVIAELSGRLKKIAAELDTRLSTL